MAELLLSRGAVTIIDDKDFERCRRFKWSFHSGGYAYRTLRCNGRQIAILLHRFLVDAQADQEVHHRDGNKLNNRRTNLEITSRAAHAAYHQPLMGPRRSRYSTYKGVTFDKAKGKWMAQIHCIGRHRFIGYFADQEEAARAYDTEARRAWGSRAYVNFPDD